MKKSRWCRISSFYSVIPISARINPELLLQSDWALDSANNHPLFRGITCPDWKRTWSSFDLWLYCSLDLLTLFIPQKHSNRKGNLATYVTFITHAYFGRKILSTWNIVFAVSTYDSPKVGRCRRNMHEVV